MIPFSVLDLSPIALGGNASQSFRNTLDLARNAERWGYRRYWLAEHTACRGSPARRPRWLIGACRWRHFGTIRVGAGGIMLPNHSPLVMASNSGRSKVAVSRPDRLGAGRAPGSDQATARALRRNLASDPDEFPQDVLELMGYFAPPAAGQRVGRSRRGAQGTDLDLGFEPLRGASRRARWGCPLHSPRISRRPDDGGDRRSIARDSAVPAARPAVRDARLQVFAAESEEQRSFGRPRCSRRS